MSDVIFWQRRYQTTGGSRERPKWIHSQDKTARSIGAVVFTDQKGDVAMSLSSRSDSLPGRSHTAGILEKSLR